MVKIKRICKQCGKDFFVYPSSKQQFCSRECHYEWLRRNRIKRVCKQCGKVFWVTPSLIKKGGGSYCSRACVYKGAIRKVKRICIQCNKPFFAIPSNINRGWAKFCSRQCFAKWKAENRDWREHLKRARGVKRKTTRPNNPERVFDGICKNNDIHFLYVGDGQLWIGKKKKLNPDFILADGRKILVEIFGDYWHSPLVNNNMKEYATLEYRKRHYKRYKWIPLFLWERDLKREDAEQFVLSELNKVGIYKT